MRKFLNIFFVSIFVIALSFLIHSKSFAENSVNSGSTASPTSKLRQEIKQDIRNGAGDGMKNTAASSGGRQKLCEFHIREVKLRERNVGSDGKMKLNRINAISEAVQKFYANRLVPLGKTIPNYDALVSDINTKKAALQPLVDKVLADSDALTCTDSKAPEQFKTFRTDAQALFTAFKAYRQSVMNLVKTVVSVAKTAHVTTTPSVVPTATVSAAQ